MATSVPRTSRNGETNIWRDDLTDFGGKSALLSATFMKGELGEELGWMLLLDQDLQELKAGLWQTLTRSVLIVFGCSLGCSFSAPG